MALKTFKPYTPSRRFLTMLDKSEITKETPEKSLIESKKRTGGRNSHGEITSGTAAAATRSSIARSISGAIRPAFPAKVAAIEYDPNRSARIALLHYADGEKRYILQPVGLEVGMTVQNGRRRGHSSGKRAADSGTFLPARWCTTSSCIRGKGGQVVRVGGRRGAVAEQRRRHRAGEAAFGRSSKFSAWIAWRRLASSAISTMKT